MWANSQLMRGEPTFRGCERDTGDSVDSRPSSNSNSNTGPPICLAASNWFGQKAIVARLDSIRRSDRTQSDKREVAAKIVL